MIFFKFCETLTLIVYGLATIFAVAPPNRRCAAAQPSAVFGRGLPRASNKVHSGSLQPVAWSTDGHLVSRSPCSVCFRPSCCFLHLLDVVRVNTHLISVPSCRQDRPLASRRRTGNTKPTSVNV